MTRWIFWGMTGRYVAGFVVTASPVVLVAWAMASVTESVGTVWWHLLTLGLPAVLGTVLLLLDPLRSFRRIVVALTIPCAVHTWIALQVQGWVWTLALGVVAVVWAMTLVCSVWAFRSAEQLACLVNLRCGAR